MTERKKRKTMEIPVTPAKPEMTDRQKAQLERQRAANLARDERPEAKLTVDKSGEKTTYTVGAGDEQDETQFGVAMMEAFGTRSLPFLNDTMGNVNFVLNKTGIPTQQQYNAALAIFAGAEPQNELEATLVSQMIGANECAQRAMRAMHTSEWTDHMKMYGDMANKFMRTFTAQCEALAKLRRGGEQVIKHVYVQEGGQAVFAGTLNTGKGFGNVGQPNGSNAEQPALSSPDPSRDGVPVPGNERQEAVPVTRLGGRPDGESESV